MRRMLDKQIDPTLRAKRRKQAEVARQRAGARHQVEYFHQSDDPYSQLACQVLELFTQRYDVDLMIHHIRATGGKNQPELEKLGAWAKRDADLIAPYYGLIPPSQVVSDPFPDPSAAALDAGSERLMKLGHYSGAMFYYGGEWFWGVDRLFYLEQWLRDVGACHQPALPYICPRPTTDVSGADASGLALDFYPSLNSPYTSIIHDITVEMARECGIQFNHKPVLPMIMRGVPATQTKGNYIVFDTKREAEHLGVPFGPMITPIGEPTRKLYSLLPWAQAQGRSVQLLSAGLNLAFAEGVGLHRKKGLRQAVERAGLDWEEAQLHLGSDDWKESITRNQLEMTDELGLWGVPSYRLRGGKGESDLNVWGQDRLWLVAAEIKRRSGEGGLSA